MFVMATSPETLGQRVRFARDALKLSSNQVGRRVGSKPGYISKIERGKIAKPTYDKLQLLSQVLEVSIDWLVDGKNAEASESNSPPVS